VAASCKHGNKSPDSIKEVKFVDQMSHHQLLKDSALCSWFTNSVIIWISFVSYLNYV
jgi:hypothetical protein